MAGPETPFPLGVQFAASPNDIPDQAYGEALFSALAVNALWQVLVRNGRVSQENASESLNLAISSLDNTEGDRPDLVRAINYAKFQLGKLLESVSVAG